MTPRVRAFTCAISAVLSVMFLGCGPEPDSPSEISLTGTWNLVAPFSVVTTLQLELTQEPDGTVRGTWRANVLKSPAGNCLNFRNPGPVSSKVAGKNTVLQVFLGVDGIGDLTGHLTSGETIRGTLLSCSKNYAVEFTRGS